jgi:hypothetical protein
MSMVAFWMALTALGLWDTYLWLSGQPTISDASRQDPILRTVILALLLFGAVLWLLHSRVGSRL